MSQAGYANLLLSLQSRRKRHPYRALVLLNVGVLALIAWALS